MPIEAAINGSRTRAEHPAIPVTPAQQAADASGAVRAGAGAIHVHARDARGQESLAAKDVTSTLEAVRVACPGIPVGASTGARILPSLSQRLSLIRAWEVLPDFASVNFHEEGAVEISRLLLDKGIGVEAGVWNAHAAHLLVDRGLAERCLRILLEPGDDDSTDVRANLEATEAALGRVTPPQLLHGIDASAWEMVQPAARRGYDTRTGFEDVLTLPEVLAGEKQRGLGDGRAPGRCRNRLPLTEGGNGRPPNPRRAARSL